MFVGNRKNVSKRKSKMISIRVSPEEYESLKNMYAASGRRSVSALAREAMQRILCSPSEGEPAADDVDSRLRSLDARLSLLQRDVAQISQVVEGAKKDRTAG